MKKYELTTDTKIVLGKKLFRIKALVSFGDVKAGDLGGYVERENNLSHEGNAWVSGNARVSDNARVYGNAWVSGNARVYGNADVYGNARVSDNAWVSDNARVYGNAWVSGNADVSGNDDYTIIQGFGSEYINTTFFKCKDGNIGVKCGCFYGTLDEFRSNVKETHKDSKFAKEYLMIADLMEYHFNSERKETDEEQNRQSLRKFINRTIGTANGKDRSKAGRRKRENE